MDETTFDAGSDPEEIAAKLGLAVVQWHDGTLYARDKTSLYSIGPVGPADPRVRVAPAPSFDGYVGEEHHTPREGALHAGLTVIEEDPSGKVVALDGFGRKFVVDKTGNGPMASEIGWAAEDELKTFTPRHRPWKPTLT
jgi:hypothetical protein